ncbi:hypothetical protein BDV24DRAFT_163776 [Aspergillus arachidicola]|uniref:Uncharacterized protein n=1 Tax=Aspergillus arachidicola TaxID=656916 RepID=A0A5N6Y9F7_9EURO|nr:hypothetical protein BDV24DRAFT_163776 [Aspergillus arachidicola]
MKAVSKEDGYYRTLGKWGIIVIGHWQTKYWFYPDGGRAGTYPSRLDAGVECCGYIDTRSRDYHLFFTHKSFDEVAGQLGSGNIWKFSDGDNEEYGDIISGMLPSGPESDGGVDENGSTGGVREETTG